MVAERARFLTLFLMFSLPCISKAHSAEQTKAKNMILSEDDERILENGEIGPVSHTIGAILAFYPGFGIGHAVQGRYGHRGWIFTVGEFGSGVLALAGALGCTDLSHGSCASAYVGILGFFGFRIWEVVDGIGGPFWDNSRYHYLQSRKKTAADSEISIMPLPVVKTGDDGKSHASLALGLNWSFR